MTKHFCEISEKEIKDGEVNHGRSPVVIPISDDLSLHMIFVRADGRCNVADVSKAGVISALKTAEEHLKKPAAAPKAEEKKS